MSDDHLILSAYSLSLQDKCFVPPQHEREVYANSLLFLDPSVISDEDSGQSVQKFISFKIWALPYMSGSDTRVIFLKKKNLISLDKHQL